MYVSGSGSHAKTWINVAQNGSKMAAKGTLHLYSKFNFLCFSIFGSHNHVWQHCIYGYMAANTFPFIFNRPKNVRKTAQIALQAINYPGTNLYFNRCLRCVPLIFFILLSIITLSAAVINISKTQTMWMWSWSTNLYYDRINNVVKYTCSKVTVLISGCSYSEAINRLG